MSLSPLRMFEHGTAAYTVWHDRAYDLLPAIVTSLRREGLYLPLYAVSGPPPHWTCEIARQVVADKHAGAVIFTCSPSVVSCVANKIPGIRAAMVSSIPQYQSALLQLNPNIVVVEMPGRTFFEMKYFAQCLHMQSQIMESSLLQTLQELDKHAHR
jgi:hypothetical protein